jgi:hypothetical protein
MLTAALRTAVEVGNEDAVDLPLKEMHESSMR